MNFLSHLSTHILTGVLFSCVFCSLYISLLQSYEKQSFHSGTPPPYNIAGTQTAGATSGQPYGQHLYIPQIPTHHNINMHQAMHQV